MAQKKPTNNPVQCPKCGTTEIRYRVTLNSFLCRKCGHQWDRKEDAKP